MAQITYKHIYDLITDAKQRGLIPIELEIKENLQTPNCVFNQLTGVFEICPIREPTITIRFREQ